MKLSLVQKILHSKYDQSLLNEFNKQFSSNGSNSILGNNEQGYLKNIAHNKIELLKNFKNIPDNLESHVVLIIDNIANDHSCFNKEDAITSLIGSLGNYEI